MLTVDVVWRGFDRFFLGRQRDDAGPAGDPAAGARRRAAGSCWRRRSCVAGREFFDWNLGKLALQSAVVSAVLGFALQDVLKNVFAGMALQTELPFDTGDWLEVDGEPRQVIGMTWRSTHLRNTLGVDFREPNANLVSARVKNLGSGVEPIALPVRGRRRLRRAAAAGQGLARAGGEERPRRRGDAAAAGAGGRLRRLGGRVRGARLDARRAPASRACAT